MLKILTLAFVLSAAPAWPQFQAEEINASQSDPQNFSLDERTIAIEKVGTYKPRPRAPREEAGAPDPLPEAGDIVNTGLDLWKIIVDNKPVADVHGQYAVALPKGVGHWEQLSGWKPPEGTVYTLTAKNGYGFTVVAARYQVLRTYGGSYKGRGRYLTAVAVEPLRVEVAWGYRLTLEAAIPPSSVVNAGSAENPVAGMLATIAWRISTPLKVEQGQSLYYLQGDGAFREVGSPFNE